MEDLNCVLNDTKLHDVHKQQNYNSLQKEENCLNKAKSYVNKEENWNVNLEQTIPSVFGGLSGDLEA